MQLHGPWTLATDGATTKQRPFVNYWAVNAQGHEVLLRQVYASDECQDASWQARHCIELFEEHSSLVGVITDNAAVMLAASTKLLDHMASKDSPRAVFTFGCAEHAAQLLQKAVVDSLEWLRPVVDDVAKMHKHIRRNKRLCASLLKHVSSVPALRKTRHNSSVRVLKSFLKLHPLMHESIMHSEPWEVWAKTTQQTTQNLEPLRDGSQIRPDAAKIRRSCGEHHAKRIASDFSQNFLAICLQNLSFTPQNRCFFLGFSSQNK